MILFPVALLIAQLPPPPPLPGQAAPPPPLHIGENTVTCPVDGETFTAPSVLTFSTMGRRPDGKPYSELSFPLPVPVCPGNGLVMFRAFTPEEVGVLTALVATPVYRRMRRSESPFYRAYWLSVKVKAPEADSLEQLLPAIWEAKQQDRGDPARPHARRYQRVLIDAVDRNAAELAPDDRAYFLFEAANALREMGDFGAAERMRQRAVLLVPVLTRKPLIEMIDQLGPVIARRDRSDDPLDMIPPIQAAIACRQTERTAPFDRAYCAVHRFLG